MKGFEVAAVKDTTEMKRDWMVNSLACFLLPHFVVLLNSVHQPVICPKCFFVQAPLSLFTAGIKRNSDGFEKWMKSIALIIPSGCIILNKKY